MTIYVDGQPFSSVRAVEQEEVTSIVDSSGRTVKRSLRGEAVIIDHPNGRTYYALLGKPNDPDYATLIAGAALRDHVRREPQSEVDAEIARRQASEPQTDSGAWLDDMAGRSRALTEVEGPRDLPRRLPPRNGRPPYEAWPMFVTFTNPADPRTVREVSPESIGVERITIEITDEDVTEGIEERLGSGFWAQAAAIHRAEMRQPGGLRNNRDRPYWNSLLSQISRIDFSREQGE